MRDEYREVVSRLKRVERGASELKAQVRDLRREMNERLLVQNRRLVGSIALEEIERTLNEGWEATDAKPGTLGGAFPLIEIHHASLLLGVLRRMRVGMSQPIGEDLCIGGILVWSS